MQRVKAQIDCGAMNIWISPSLLRKLELPYEPAFNSTLGLNGQVMMSAKDSRKASLLIQCLNTLNRLTNRRLKFVVPIKVYDLVLGLTWRETRKSTGVRVDWQPYERQIDCNGWRFHKRIAQVLCRNAVGDIKSCFPLPHSIISEPLRTWSRHLPYDLANVKGCWEHHWKASPNVRENPRCWTHEQEQRQ